MGSVSASTSIRQFQDFIKETYGLPNDRHFDLGDMLTNIQRFAMRGVKGIRKGDVDKTKKNLVISLSWFMSVMNRLHIDLEDEIWQRFPYLCSYCGSCPCACKVKKVQERISVPVDDSRRPQTMNEFQAMFNAIYPAKSRTLEHAGVHLAEETGEFSEALLSYRGERRDQDFEAVMFEAADYFSCLMGVFNSLGIDLSQELAKHYTDNCHECHKAPCACSFWTISRYGS